MSPETPSIPEWEPNGLLPPVPKSNPLSRERSPYLASLVEIVDRFGGTTERRRLLTGLMDYRARLHAAGLVRGFQWIDGSFVEDIEWVEGRAPRDIDVVNFFYLPEGRDEETLHQAYPALFDAEAVKRRHAVDAYQAPLRPEKGEDIVDDCTYWGGVWSHKRYTWEWKGYVRVGLSPDGDEAARRRLAERSGA